MELTNDQIHLNWFDRFLPYIFNIEISFLSPQFDRSLCFFWLDNKVRLNWVRMVKVLTNPTLL